MEGKAQETEFVVGVPNKFKDLTWPQYDRKAQRFLEISGKPKISDHYRANKVAFWDSFLPNFVKVIMKWSD